MEQQLKYKYIYIYICKDDVNRTLDKYESLKNDEC